MDKKFTRSKDRKIAGVCGGIAEYLNIDPVIVRAVFLCLLFFGGSGFIVYLILVVVMPEQDPNYTGYVEVNEDEEKKTENTETENIMNEIPKKALNTGSLIFGLLLILAGVFFFLRNFFPFFRFEYCFPLVLIVVGILLISFSKKSKKQ
ncbi:MAG: PspC domain-containing protein [Bacteroidales bacterium]|jgi:phage shock protein C|nr:PspC domain-containing protein [Bacteroidales bacterium]